MALSTCCATACGTDRITCTCSTARRPPATSRPGNAFEHNRFTVTRQLRYSRDETQRALDIGLFVNGLPVFTFELKNRLTKQTVDDAVQQYRKDRNWREKLFEFGRCVAHFAVDDSEARFCTRLQGKSSWFLPFNRGWNDGAGNPPNPDGIKTDYLWRAVLSRDSLTDILENYAQVVKTRDEKTGRKKRDQVWPRYHQLDVVRRLLADAGTHGAGRRFAILIDEAHSSQGGRTSGAMTQALAEAGQADEEEMFEDQINRLMASRRLLPNASYFAFTATPKNKTLEIFGDQEPQRPVFGKQLPFAVHRGDFDPVRVARTLAGSEIIEGACRNHPDDAFILEGRLELVAGQRRIGDKEIAAGIESQGHWK